MRIFRSPAAQRDARLRVGRNQVHQSRAFLIGHDLSSAPQKLREFHDGLQAGHLQAVLYANGV